ncbi:MAG: hypothetical protein ACOX8B_08310 [Lachnospiraceae bacterium]|jgi:hypothetical protein
MGFHKNSRDSEDGGLHLVHTDVYREKRENRSFELTSESEKKPLQPGEAPRRGCYSAELTDAAVEKDRSEKLPDNPAVSPHSASELKD